MKSLRVARYLVLLAIRNMRNTWRLHALTTATIGTSFLILSGSLLAFSNLKTMLLGSQAEPHVSVYFTKELREAERQKLIKEVCNESFIQGCEYRSARQARALFAQNNPELQGPVAELSKNPFPASLEIKIDPELRRAQELHAFSKKMEARLEVEFVDDGGSWVDRWTLLLSLADWLMWGMGLALGFAALFVLANTIKLMVYARRDEVEILNLVGASDTIVRVPFLLEGLTQGLLGALLALGILRLGFLYLIPKLQSHVELFPSALHFLSPCVQVGLVIGGALLGVFGSLMAVRRYLK